ncbi:Predicted flavoprotein CzcO associated with the cation diffusion facilitator CzcD [Mycolicibacterium rutilum]|uniref:Predicted flavoprotein CzcO associated with the cation diffusion facilitator CzcD n=1 Tax=Mycolicibacterium rutilum TaxID=370526 RepID=A0A1H6L4X1_MYCRU|nr:NAD(P)-binding domain-containing protein [Mycolicibacterium rutilum]SEH79364.1 Predicted flavoprotein CzcO associated with the cation diffusion facilitator CzcD [Mycolicibacterium rutilum]
MTATGRVAVIGAGPGGLVAARWLRSQGFTTTIFEQGDEIGGQWTGRPGRSGVWPAMHTNTSRVLTAFGDLDPGPGATFPSNHEVLGYLHRYADQFDLPAITRLGTRVRRVRRTDGGWLVATDSGVETFERVVVATGRFQTPVLPAVAGLDTFTGSVGAHSSYDFRDPARYRGKRVLVAGGAISALEITAELVFAGADRVVLTQRRQRYVLPKLAGGVPTDHRVFTRYGALAAERLPADEIDRQLKEIVLEAAGEPQQYGAPAPHPSLSVAGVTLSQHYLPLVAEGRIVVRPWLTAVAGDRVTFADGRSEQFDGIVFGTGFRVAMPFLDETMHRVLDRHTFHPELPGLAFVGMWDQSGGYFVPLELQARWIAYAWAGLVEPPVVTPERPPGEPQKTRMNLVAVTFARAAGVEPTLSHWPGLHRALLFGPLAPSCFRLEGPDAAPDATQRFARDAAAFGAITSNTMTERETAYWRLLGSDT